MKMQTLRANLERHMRELCLNIGTRHTGSPGERAAAEYIAGVFESYGYAPIFEEYPTVGWELKSFSLCNMTENRPVPAAEACFFSQSADVEGKLLWLTAADIVDIEKITVENRICFIECWSSAGNVMGRNKIAEVLDSKGAAAAIFISNIHTSLAPSTKIERSPFLKQLGVCAVSQEGAFDIARHKNDTYRVKIEARCFDNVSRNVIATCAGNHGYGVFGAHYDTAPLVQGAGDNATGTAMVLELARLLRDDSSGMKLDFVEFSAEEYIPYVLPPGSEDYVRRRRDEKIDWMMNFDDFGLLIGEPIVRGNMFDKLPPFKSKRYRVVESDVYNGDDKSFGVAGIPTLWYYDSNPFSQLHTSCDSIDTIDFGKMAEGVLDAVDLFKQLRGVQ